MTSSPPSRAPPDDLVTFLAKAAAWRDLPPRLAFITDAPVSETDSEVFGLGAAAVVPPAALTQRAVESLDPDEGTGIDVAQIDPSRASVVARFNDPSALEGVLHWRPDWIARCAALIRSFPLSATVRQSLATAGFASWRAFGTARGGLYVAAPTTPVIAEGCAADRPFRPPLKTLAIVDPCLGAARGHYLQHAQLLSAGGKAHGIRVILLAQYGLAGQNPPEGGELICCFRRCFIDLQKNLEPESDLSEEIFDAWASVVDSVDSPDIHYLIHSADGHLIRASDKMIRARRDLQGAVHLVMHVEPRRLAGRALQEEVHRILVRMRRSPAWERSLFLWAENRPLAAWLSEWLQANIPVPPALIGVPGTRQGPAGNRLQIAFLGEARASKGFLELPLIADAIAADKSLSSMTSFNVQWHPPLGRDLGSHLAAVDRLRQHSFVHIISGDLDRGDYCGQLAAADACIFPYDPDLYRLRGSGVLLEAVAQGVALIVRAGSALVDTATNGLAFEYRRPEEIPEILRRLLAERPRMRLLAERRARRFRSMNNPERFIRVLDRRVRRLAEFR